MIRQQSFLVGPKTENESSVVKYIKQLSNRHAYDWLLDLFLVSLHYSQFLKPTKETVSLAPFLKFSTLSAILELKEDLNTIF